MAKNETIKAATPKSVLDLAKKEGAKMVDIKFVDTFGTWQHFSCPIDELTEDVFTDVPTELWSRVLTRKGGSYALIARMPLDPGMN